MILTAGFRSVEDYIPCARAGAGELFCGYVPLRWQLQYGCRAALNRRETLYADAQLGSESELRILASMVQDEGIPVALTLNALSYPADSYPMLAETILRCRSLGFTRFIVADVALLVYLHEQKISREIEIHVSGEFGEFNRPELRLLKELGVHRLIFHRQNTPEEMELLIGEGLLTEYEAFYLNEKCHFHGAFCSSLHCDELPPLCRIPYRLAGASRSCGLEEAPEDETQRIPGASGCGFCSLWKLRRSGVTHLKIVGRGNRSREIISDISAARRTLDILERCSSEDEYLREMKAALFPSGCSRHCYYL